MAQRAYEMPFKNITVTKPAATDFSAARYKFVTINSSGEAVLAGAGIVPIGVLQQPGEVDKGPMDLPAMVAGVSFIIIGTGGLASGDDVSTGASGVAVKATAAVLATTLATPVVGKCMVGGAAGEIGCILLK
jgi:hypothetical protein